MIHNVSMAVRAGEIVTLIGPNGAGKTTLLKLLLGLEMRDSGDIIRASELRIGYMPQNLVIHPSMPLTVKGFLRLYADDSSLLLKPIAEQFAIESLLNQPVQNLSGGEWRRVLLARAMLKGPNLLVLDEPLAGVDISGQTALYQLIEDVVKQQGCGVLMVSHDLHLVMASTHHVICLNHHICCEGEPHQIGGNPAFAAMFGQEMADRLALYTHTHDHTHDLHGDVVHTGEGHDHGTAD